MSEPLYEPEFTNIDLEDRKRIVAHQLWEDCGRPEGLAEKHWEQACLIILSIPDMADVKNPEWLKTQDENFTPKSTIVLQKPSLDIKQTMDNPWQTAQPSTSMEDIKNRLLKRSAA